MSETQNLNTDVVDLNKAIFAYEAAMNEYQLTLMKIDKELEMKHYVLESTYEDQTEIDRAYMEAEEQANKAKEGALKKAMTAISSFIQMILDKIKGTNRIIDAKALYTNGELTLDDVEKVNKVFDEQAQLLNKANEALKQNDVKKAREYFDRADALYTDPNAESFQKKTSRAFKKVAPKVAGTALVAGTTFIVGKKFIDTSMKITAVTMAYRKIAPLIARAAEMDDDLTPNTIKDRDDINALQKASTSFPKRMANIVNNIRMVTMNDDQKVSFIAALNDKNAKKAQAKQKIRNTLTAGAKLKSDIETGRYKDGVDAEEPWTDNTWTFTEFLNKFFDGNLPEIHTAPLVKKYQGRTFPKFTDGDKYEKGIVFPNTRWGVAKLKTTDNYNPYYKMMDNLRSKVISLARLTDKPRSAIIPEDYIILFDVWGFFSRKKIGSTAHHNYCFLQTQLYDHYVDEYSAYDRRSIVNMWRDAFTGRADRNRWRNLSLEEGSTSAIDSNVYKLWMWVFTEGEYRTALGDSTHKMYNTAKDIKDYFDTHGGSVPRYIFRKYTNAEIEDALKKDLSLMEYPLGKDGKPDESKPLEFVAKRMFKHQNLNKNKTIASLGINGNVYRWKLADWKSLSSGGQSTIKKVMGEGKDPVFVDADDKDIPRLSTT